MAGPTSFLFRADRPRGASKLAALVARASVPATPFPNPTPRSALKVWHTARLRPLARCATERLRRSPKPQRHPTASAHKTRSVASSLASIFALQAQAFAALGVSLLVPAYPLIRCTRSATWPAVCQHALRHVAHPKQVEALSPLIQADRSHRYGYAKAVHGLFPCGQWTEDCPPLHLRLSALVGLNSRGMVIVLDLHCAATDSCTARVSASAHCVRRYRLIGLQGSWRAAKRPASPRCGHYARTCPITAQSP